MTGVEDAGSRKGVPVHQLNSRDPDELSDIRGLAGWLPDRIAAISPTITVVGDVMLDGWWSGTIERFCREAPAPVVDLTHRQYAPGGAANTAMNLAALGARVRITGLIGTDDAGRKLAELLTSAGVDTTYLLRHAEVSTTTKFRVMGGDQVMLRLDDASGAPVPEAMEALAEVLPAALMGSSAVIVCDYGSGNLSGPVRSALVTASRSLLTVVDAHDPRPWAVLEPDLATPNAQEAAQLLGIRPGRATNRTALMNEHGPELLEATGAAAVVVTLDRDGTTLLTASEPGHRTWARPAAEKQASGAGDTFVACLTMARAVGLPLATAQDLAQVAADVVVRRSGTSVCSTADLATYLGRFPDTILDADELVALLAGEREAGRRIVLTNGCFDVLHRGHTRYLNQAKELGDILVVALNGDDSVRRLKGPQRPINPLADRAGVIAALSCVDYVTAFDTDTPVPLIEALRPHVYAKGGDYSPEMLEETKAVEANDGVVRILDYVPEHSTTAVLERIQHQQPGAQPAADRKAGIP